MTFWTPETLRAACAGSWIVRPPQIELPKDRPADMPPPPLHAPISGLSTDTRTLRPGQVFLALRGENFDGHRFVGDAARAGAPILIIDDPECIAPDRWDGRPPVGVMKVADTGQALLRIAAAYRRTLERTRVVAVCGSNGKTTTTTLIGQLLSACGLRGSTSRRSFNNAVGVPLTILAAQPTDQYLVCEVGTNAPGEVAALAEVVQPDIAVVTSIGREHLEKLGDLAGVAREEGSVFRSLRPKGCAVINDDHPELKEHAEKAAQVITFGRSDQANFRLTSVRHLVESGFAGIELVFNGRFAARVPMLGEHNALNALAALAVARRFGVDEQRAIAALATARGPDMRMQVETIADAAGGGSTTVLNDAYNANPDSMIAAVRTLAAVAASVPEPPRRVVAVLADMLELGEASPDGHRSVGAALAEAFGPIGAADPARRKGPPVEVILVGPAMMHAASALDAAGWPPDAMIHLLHADDAAMNRVAAMLRPGDLVLLKGSRRMRLERVLERLRSPAAKGGDRSPDREPFPAGCRSEGGAGLTIAGARPAATVAT